MNYEKAQMLLNIIHMTVELPQFHFIRDAAVKELEGMRPVEEAPKTIPSGQNELGEQIDGLESGGEESTTFRRM